MSTIVVTSPDETIQLTVREIDGRLTWRIERSGVSILDESDLRIAFGDLEVHAGISILDAGSQVDEHFAMERAAGKQRSIAADGRRRTIIVGAANDTRLAIDLCVFDDAVAHRFRQLDALGAGRESTTFVFPEGSSKYVQPYDQAGIVQPASEALYSGAMPIDHVLPVDMGWSLPALFETPGGWALLGETAVGADCDGSRITNDGRVHALAGPLDDQLGGPIDEPPAGSVTFPWKVLVIGDLQDVVASNAFELLATPTPMFNTDWIRPGRVSWSWWSESDSPRNPERLRDFIDFASELGWEYTLIDANWNQMPEGTIEALIAYGAERNVGIFLWYNSGGAHNRVPEEPRDRMDERSRRRAEMAWLHNIGVAGLKVDFFQSDLASMNRLAHEMLEEAAEFKLLMNLHGMTSPKGWHATWPHLLTTEAVRGAEQYKFAPHFPETAPAHNTVLPFTRNVVGPMDYTPMTLSDSLFPHHTTATHELALGIVFESALQHPADSPESYRRLGAQGLDFLRRMPVVWDDVRLLSGRPGDHVVLARRHGDEWWIGGINGMPRPRSLDIDLSELGGTFAVATDTATRDDVHFSTAKGLWHVTLEPFGGCLAWPV